MGSDSKGKLLQADESFLKVASALKVDTCLYSVYYRETEERLDDVDYEDDKENV